MTKGKETDLKNVAFDGMIQEEWGWEKRIIERDKSLNAHIQRHGRSRHFQEPGDQVGYGWSIE